jgi:predicted transcriptional regulator
MSVNDEPGSRAELLELTSNIVCSYVGNNPTATADLSNIITEVFGKLSSVGMPAAPEADLTPAVPVKKSVTSDAIVCLECGKQQKMLKRHLFTAHGTTPDEYRAKWQLGYDYPMIAPAYAEMRQAIAKKIGLGRKPGKTAKPAAKRTRKKA